MGFEGSLESFVSIPSRSAQFGRLDLDAIAFCCIVKQLQKSAKAFAQLRITFNVDADLFHHRVPPISPMRHRCPKENSLSHSSSGSGSSRRKWLPVASSRSHTSTDSGLSAETRSAECVVTISCVR